MSFLTFLTVYVIFNLFGSDLITTGFCKCRLEQISSAVFGLAVAVEAMNGVSGAKDRSSPRFLYCGLKSEPLINYNHRSLAYITDSHTPPYYTYHSAIQ